jgi:hypothetical protein
MDIGMICISMRLQMMIQLSLMAVFIDNLRWRIFRSPFEKEQNSIDRLHTDRHNLVAELQATGCLVV